MGAHTSEPFVYQSNFEVHAGFEAIKEMALLCAWNVLDDAWLKETGVANKNITEIATIFLLNISDHLIIFSYSSSAQYSKIRSV